MFESIICTKDIIKICMCKKLNAVMSDTLKKINQLAVILELATIATFKLMFQYSIIK